MNKTLATLSVSLVFALAASQVNADSSVYVAVTGLNAEFDNAEREAGFSVAVGKYLGKNKRVSLEAGYTDFGTVGDSNNEYEVTAAQFSAVGYVPLTEYAGIYGRAGVERIRVEGNTTVGNTQISGSVYETNPYYGAGAYYDLTENIDVRVEYQRHEVFEVDVDTINAGITIETF